MLRAFVALACLATSTAHAGQVYTFDADNIGGGVYAILNPDGTYSYEPLTGPSTSIITVIDPYIFPEITGMGAFFADRTVFSAPAVGLDSVTFISDETPAYSQLTLLAPNGTILPDQEFPPFTAFNAGGSFQFSLPPDNFGDYQIVPTTGDIVPRTESDPPSATPEPSSMILALIGLTILVAYLGSARLRA